MAPIWMLSAVSFCLFCNGVITAPSSSGTADSESLSAAVLNRRSLLKPYLSEYNHFYDNPDGQNNGRSILNAIRVDKTVEPFVIHHWVKTEGLPITPDTNEDEVSPTKYPAMHNIYRTVLNLLLKKMYKWVQSDDSLESIEYYLGYDEETVDLINMSMTELFSRQRKRDIKIDSLAQLFYYSCDVKNMVKKELLIYRRDIVNRKFLYYLNKFTNFLTPGELENKQDKKLVQELKHNLKSIDDKTHAPFGIAIPSMKMWIITNESDDEQIELLQNRGSDPSVLTVKTYVDGYSQESEGNKINEYHFKILGVVARHVFGYVYIYFELLSKLREHVLDEGDKSVIKHFKTFVNAYTSVFIDRYFEFKGEVSQELVDALFPLMYFLDPSDPQTPDVNCLTEDETSVLNEHSPPKFSMDNYFIDPEINDEFDQYMMSLIDNAVQKLLDAFPEENTDDWNSLLQINYGEQLDKKTLLNLMSVNNENAINILVKFASELSIDERLYDKYGLND